MRIARTIEFDAGHRVPSHDGKCRSPHGHRYKVEVVIEGDVQRKPGTAEDGMVLDFGKLADVLRKNVHDPMDHAFLFWGDDLYRNDFLADPTWKVYEMTQPPTAECIAEEVAQIVGGSFNVVEVTVWETPNCWARWTL